LNTNEPQMAETGTKPTTAGGPLETPVKVAFNGVRNVRVSGWQLWPVRKSLDGSAWLCRWCAKPLSGQMTSYCSRACAHELYVRATIPGVREFAIKRASGHCESCGVDLVELAAAFKWYSDWFRNLPHKLDRGGMKTWEKGGWPVTAAEFRDAAGYKSNGHLWEVNHKHSITEGGDPTDPTNLEVLCLKCHRIHTKGIAQRKAKARRNESQP
jgi:hypothetical protein